MHVVHIACVYSAFTMTCVLCEKVEDEGPHLMRHHALREIEAQSLYRLSRHVYLACIRHSGIILKDCSTKRTEHKSTPCCVEAAVSLIASFPPEVGGET